MSNFANEDLPFNVQVGFRPTPPPAPYVELAAATVLLVDGQQVYLTFALPGVRQVMYLTIDLHEER